MTSLVSAIASNFQDAPKIENKFNFKKNKLLTAFVITMINDHASTVATRRCIQSIKETNSQIDCFILNATTPSDLKEHLDIIGFSLNEWTYPKSPAETSINIKTGLKLTGYKATDYTKVVSCLVSHARAWYRAIEVNQPIMVLEHDCVFTKQFKWLDVCDNFTGGILGLNDPRGATRKAQLYHEKVVDQKSSPVAEVPWIDSKDIPQGLAGNSAYIIKPSAAEHLIEKVKHIGLWPNDALMCKQLFPWLQQTYPYYTRVQGIKSSTTL